jgi:hypothetical protein
MEDELHQLDHLLDVSLAVYQRSQLWEIENGRKK